MTAFHRNQVFIAIPLALTLAGCGGGEEDTRTSDSQASGIASVSITATDATGLTNASDGSSTGSTSPSGSDSDSDTNSTTNTTTTTDDPTTSSGSGIKFDVGLVPDGGSQGCGDSGGGMGDEVFSYIWIANSSQNTVSKVNTKTGVEEGRYYVEGGSPSRTSVNLQGDVAVSSRNPGGVTKIAAQIENCVDSNNDGVITTSIGANDIKPLGTDECVLWRKPVPSTGHAYGPRATAWEGTEPDPGTCIAPTPRLWFAWMDANSTAHFMRVDGATGETISDITYPWGSGYSPYGGAVTADGDFVATGLNTQPAVRIDSETEAITDLGIPGGCKYGMTLDVNGNIWVGGCIGGHIYHYDFNSQQWTDLGVAGGSRVNGIMADREGNVWGAGSDSCRLVHIDVETKSFVNTNIPLPGCSNPWGVSIDVDGYVWVVDMSANLAYKVDPDTYQIVTQVSGLVGPYTYSDMTGAGLNLQVNPPG